MINLKKLTDDEANKIECALLMLSHEIEETIAAYEKAATYPELTETARKTMASNAQWWREVYELLYNS